MSDGNKAAHGPLSGLRVLEIGHYVAAPFCTRVLADLGADVIKIEPPQGDPVRKWGEQVDGHSLWWSVHGRNKRSVTIDLKAPRAFELIMGLVERCDVLVENLRPGRLARLGFSDEALSDRNRRLVIAHISGFGQNGPYRDRASFGAIGEAMGGLRYLTNHPAGTTDLPPVRVGISLGDSVAGLYGALGIVAAIWQRDTTHNVQGKDLSVDVALTDAVLSLMEGLLPEYGQLGKIRKPAGSRIATTAPSSAYPSADGSWVLIAANSEALFERLAHLMEMPDLLSNPLFSDNASSTR